MQRGFLLGGLMVVPFILLMWLFGLAWVAMEPDGEASVALFALVMPNLPAWVALAFIPLGLALVMSSADTAISAITSIIAVDGARLLPQAPPTRLLRLPSRCSWDSTAAGMTAWMPWWPRWPDWPQACGCSRARGSRWTRSWNRSCWPPACRSS